MEVTKDNFKKAYDILEKEIENVDFISIDAEFTGLSTIKTRGHGYDMLEDIYTKTRVGTGQILLIQYGVCLFTWNEENNHYEAMPFTFYIFPQPYKKYGNDVMFMSQSSSLSFLARNGFDFNKLFHKGISFMTPFEEEKAKEKIAKEIAFFVQKELDASKQSVSSASESKVSIPENQIEFINTISDSVVTFMNDDDSQCIDLPICNPFQRKLIYEKMEERYPLGLYLECVTNENNEKFIRVHKTAASGIKKFRDEKQEKEEKMLEEVIGFSKVIKLIAKSKKPLIGHNMLLDLFLTTTNFFGPPPLCLQDFKEFVNKLFPVIFDTKVIANTSRMNQILSNTSLEKMIASIDAEQLPNPKVIISEKLKEEAEYTSAYHQAGYDAYCTGRIFISEANYVLSCSSDRIDLTCDLLNQYINHVYIMGIRDISFTDLCKEDIVPKRQNVFYIRFPVSWKQTNIEELFSPYCSLRYPINWINEESAFVTVSEGSYNDIFVNLVMNSGYEQSYYVLPYNDYINNKDPRRRMESNQIDKVPLKRKRVDSEVEDGEICNNAD